MLSSTNTVSARDIQRQYKRIFEKVKASKEPTVVIANNRPQVVIIDVGTFEKMETAHRIFAQKYHQELVEVLGKEAHKQNLTEKKLLGELRKERSQVYQETYGISKNPRHD